MQNDKQIFCRENTLTGEQQVFIDSINDIKFKMFNSMDKIKLAEVKFSVLYISKKKVHMRKVPWRVM